MSSAGRIGATADERDVVALALGVQADEVREQARLALEDATQLLGLGRRQVEPLPACDVQFGEVVDQVAGAGHERLFEVGCVGARPGCRERRSLSTRSS